MKSIAKKLISCAVALALCVGLTPVVAFGSASVGQDKGIATSSKTATATTEIGLIVGAGFYIADPISSMYEEGYSKNEAISVLAVDGVAPFKEVKWEYAEASFSANGTPLYDTVVKKPVQNTTGDSQTQDAENANAVVVSHFPQNELLKANGTYWYWLTVIDADGNKAVQATDKPYVVSRQSMFRSGPFTDNAQSSGWTWAIAGSGVTNIGNHQITNTADGGIHAGITLSSSQLNASGADKAAYEALQSAANDMLTKNAWTVAITEVQPETDDAYKGRILVALDVSGIDMPSVAAGATPVPGKDFNIFRLSADGKSAIAVSGLKYENGIVTFYADDSGASGKLGTYSIAVAPKPEDVQKAFVVDTVASPGEFGTVSAGGEYQFGQEPAITFAPKAGYKVKSVQLAMKPSKDSSAAAVVATIPKSSDNPASAPYGTWEGNSYKFPANFNNDKQAGYTVLTVSFEVDPEYVEPTELKLDIYVDGPGAVYMGALLDATKVTGEGHFESGNTYGNFTLQKNTSVPLSFVANNTTCVLESLYVNGEKITGAGASYTIFFNADTTVRATFKDNSLPPELVKHKVWAEYDTNCANVGFGALETGLVSEAEIPDGTNATMVVQPKTGYRLESALKYVGSATTGIDVTADCADGTLELVAVSAPTRVKFEFSEIALRVNVGQAPFGGSVVSPAPGEHSVTITNPLEVVIKANAGYEIDGPIKLGDRTLNILNKKENPDGSIEYTVSITYADAQAAGEGAQLAFNFAKTQQPERTHFTISATAGANGRVAAKTTVVRGEEAKVSFFPNDGYRVAYVLVDGKRVTGVGAATDANIECDIQGVNPHIKFKSVTEDYQIEVAFERIPAAGEGDTGENPGAQKPNTPVVIKLTQPNGDDTGEGEPGGAISPSGTAGDNGSDDVLVYPGDDQTITFVPKDGSWIVDTVVVDGVEILDENGVELKDKLTQTDNNGYKYDSDIPIKYDPATDEYVTENPDGTESRFKLNTEKGTIKFIEIKNGYTVSGGFAKLKNVYVSLNATAQTSASGSITPLGQFGWKKKLPLVIVAAPNEGCEIESLNIDGKVYSADELLDATAEHVRQAKDAQRQADLYNLMQLQTGSAVYDLNQTVQVVWPDETVPHGAKAYIIPAEYFRSDAQAVTVSAQFAKERKTVVARVQGGHGKIAGTSNADEALTVKIADGAGYTVSYAADEGYRVKSVTDNGVAVSAFTETSYRIDSVTENHEVIVEFESYAAGPAAAPTNPIYRTLRHLSSLAQTGDLNGIGVVAFVGVACAAAGVAVLLANRRRRESETAAHVAK